MAVSSLDRQKFWSSRDWTLTIQREMTDYRQGVGHRLHALRKSRHMSQEDAAHEVGVRVKTWGLWERGVSAPYERNWQKIKTAFHLTDEQVTSIRGTPPAPLGLGSDGEVSTQLDRIEAKLDELLRRTGGKLSGYQLSDEDVAANAEIDAVTKELEAEDEHAERPPDTGEAAGPGHS